MRSSFGGCNALLDEERRTKLYRAYCEYALTKYNARITPPKPYRFDYCMAKCDGAGGLAYVVRNEIMVLACDVLLVYYHKEYSPSRRKASGTRMAVEFAIKKKKRIINILNY